MVGWGYNGEFIGGMSGSGFQVVQQNYDSTVWIGNIPEGVSWEEIKAKFASAGTVKYVDLIKRGKEGFIWFSKAEEAQMAITMFDGSEINGQAITVDAWKRRDRDREQSSEAHSWPPIAKGKGGKGTAGTGKGVIMPHFTKHSWGYGGKAGGGRGSGGLGGSAFQVLEQNVDSTVWIGNIPEGVTWEAIKEKFDIAGTVKYVDLIKKGTEGLIWFSTAEEAQQAIAMFNGSEIKGQAISVDAWRRKETDTEKVSEQPYWPPTAKGKGGEGTGGHALGAMTAHFSNSTWGYGGKAGGGKVGGGMGGGGFQVLEKNYDSTVWIGNIPSGITWEVIKDKFATAGSIKYVDLVKWGTEGFIWFSNAQEAQQAITMFNGSEINGQAIIVDAWRKK